MAALFNCLVFGFGLVWFNLGFLQVKINFFIIRKKRREFQMVMDLHIELISISNDLAVHVKLLTKKQNHKTSSYYHAFLFVMFYLFFCLK